MSPDSQGHATDWRFAVCSFKDAWEEEEPALQMQVKDPSYPRPLEGAAQAKRLQDSSLSREVQSPSEPKAMDRSGNSPKTTLGDSLVQTEQPAFSGVESLLCPMSSHLSLAQGESDSPGRGLVGGPGSGGALPAGFGLGEQDSNPVDLGDPLPEISSKLLEAGKGG